MITTWLMAETKCEPKAQGSAGYTRGTQEDEEHNLRTERIATIVNILEAP